MTKKWLIGALAVPLAAAGLAFVRAQEADAPPPDDPASYPSGQPIAFPHNIHAGTYKMDCQYCHFSAERSVDAGLPPLETCMGCHRIIPGTNKPEEIQKLQDYYNRGEPVPWVRIYKISDHAHFPHMRHIKAGLQCQQCHGEVQETEVLNRPNPVWGGKNMGWCVACHRKEGASDDCSVCHY